jgi:hypothetical protein
MHNLLMHIYAQRHNMYYYTTRRNYVGYQEQSLDFTRRWILIKIPFKQIMLLSRTTARCSGLRRIDVEKLIVSREYTGDEIFKWY